MGNISSMFGGLRNIKFSKTQNFGEILNYDLRRSSTRLEDYYLNNSSTFQREFFETKDSDQTNNAVNESDSLIKINSNYKGIK